MNPGIHPTCRVHVLVVSPLESEHILLAHIFGHTAWEVDSARSVREATLKLCNQRLAGIRPVILCDEILADGSWKDLFHVTQEFPEPHSLIVTATNADDRLWSEVLNLGAYDVLENPLRSQEVFRAVSRAWADRRLALSRGMHRQAAAAAGALA